MDELTLFINSKNRINTASSINNAQYYFDFNKVLSPGRYKLRWSMIHLANVGMIQAQSTLIKKTYVDARYFKFQIDAVRASNSNGSQMSKLNLYYDEVRIPTTEIIASADSSSPGGEGVYNLFSSDIWAKWFSTKILSTILFTFPSEIRMNQYNYMTASDATFRDPISWKLFYSINNIDWVLLDTQVNYPVTTGRVTNIPIITVTIP